MEKIMSKETYQEYLKSDHWKQLKSEKVKRTVKKCAICTDDHNIDLHHLIYRNWTDVETKDLRWLCRICHTVAHDLLRSGKLKYKSESHHSRFASTKFYVRKARGINAKSIRAKKGL